MGTIIKFKEKKIDLEKLTDEELKRLFRVVKEEQRKVDEKILEYKALKNNI